MKNFFNILFEADAMKVDVEKPQENDEDQPDNFDNNIQTTNDNKNVDNTEEADNDDGEKNNQNDEDNDVEAEADEDGEQVTDEDQPDDFDGNVDGDGDGNPDNEETTDDQNNDTNTEQENNENSTKNYNLLCDFNNLFNVVKNTMQRLDSIEKPNIFYTQVIKQCVKNLGTIKESMTNYINFNFGKNDYTKNLYMYNYYFQALKVVVNMIKTLNSHTLDKTNK